MPIPDFMTLANADYIESLYRQYLTDPRSLDEGWVHFFAGFELGRGGSATPEAPVLRAVEPPERRPSERAIDVFEIVHSYRELGHLLAQLNPLGGNETSHPLLQPEHWGLTEADLGRLVDCQSFRGCTRAKLHELIDLLRATYCGTLGVEYIEISDKAQRDWLQDRMEPNLNRPALTPEDKKQVLAKLTQAEVFEQFLQTKYVGQKRFSLEGGDALIPLLDVLIEDAGHLGADEIVLGMAHRGRLNVLANILHKPYEMIFSEFQGVLLPRDIQGDGDVKYHLGYSRDHTTRGGQRVHLSLSFNPSHLEAIDPVVEGIVRAKQRYRRDEEHRRVIPLLIHGDAAFTGQGIVAETIGLSELEAYRTGGTVHVIINNQIGFTTSPIDYRFSRYPSDVAKLSQTPVFHVNGDDPEAAAQAAKLAIGFRQTFRKDVIIDLVCYRRHGHNEADDPTFTQPVMYRTIAEKKTPRALYAERLVRAGVVTDKEVQDGVSALRDLFNDALDYARDFMPRQQVFTLGGAWQGMSWAGEDWSAKTAVPRETLAEVMRGVRELPEDFAIHPKAKRLYDHRAEAFEKGAELDWGNAEMLAFGSLLLEGTHLRLTGQDVGRGTFSHRHAVLRDINTDERYVPLDHLRPGQAEIHVIDTMLSEEAVLGFEYGFSSADPRNLVIWEAQFGDFANGAQVVIDQFISSAESKWQRMSGITLLLPHGYEGQGPEHSSARLERYLQLCAERNLQVCNFTTPAQYFHALRRQVHRNFRKPLVVMSPKSLLRHKLAVSTVEELTAGTFRCVIGEVELPLERAQRVVLCTGKIYYELLVARREQAVGDVALVRVEQLYPFPGEEIRAELARYPSAREVFWVQEEPWNMGAWWFVAERLPAFLDGRTLSYVGRDEAASPAPGSYKVHQAEEAEVVNKALRRIHAR